MTVMSDSALITNVGYNNAGYTSLVCKGTSQDLWNIGFVVIITPPHPNAYYNPGYYNEFKGKTVNFTYTGVNSNGKPIGIEFVDIV